MTLLLLHVIGTPVLLSGSTAKGITSPHLPPQPIAMQTCMIRWSCAKVHAYTRRSCRSTVHKKKKNRNKSTHTPTIHLRLYISPEGRLIQACDTHVNLFFRSSPEPLCPSSSSLQQETFYRRRKVTKNDLWGACELACALWKDLHTRTREQEIHRIRTYTHREAQREYVLHVFLFNHRHVQISSEFSYAGRWEPVTSRKKGRQHTKTLNLRGITEALPQPPLKWVKPLIQWRELEDLHLDR